MQKLDWKQPGSEIGWWIGVLGWSSRADWRKWWVGGGRGGREGGSNEENKPVNAKQISFSVELVKVVN